MSGRAVYVPELVRQKAMAQGAEGRRWLERLGSLIDELERAWGVSVGATLHGGSGSYVAAAKTDAGGDAHSDNALRDPEHTTAARARFKLVDPDGLLAEPAYDLGILMREWSRELLCGDAARLGRERCARLSRLTGVDPRPIWEWGFVERVSTGLLVTRVGAEELGREMLDVAEAWTRS